MKKYSNYLYLAAFISLMIPTPGRFVFGFTLLLELLLLTIFGNLFYYLLERLNFTEVKHMLVLAFLITFATLYKEIFVIAQTEVALVLGLLFYLPPLSIFVIYNILRNRNKPLVTKVIQTGPESLLFFLFGLVFFLLRDILAYGTFTFYGPNHMIYEAILIENDTAGFFTFFASIQGVLLIFGLILMLAKYIDYKFEIIENLEKQNALS